MAPTRTAIVLPFVNRLFDDAGSIQNPGFYNTAVARVLDDLVWWARALKAARERGYPNRS
jgi:hypothetical protein